MIRFKNRFLLLLAIFATLSPFYTQTLYAGEEKPLLFQAGAAAVDITPTLLPVIVNGYINERTATQINDPLMSRALVLDDGYIRLAIVVVDSLMIGRDLLDAAKSMASKATGIPTDKILISSTHIHTAASAMECLGSRQDPAYSKFLPGKISESIIEAAKNLVPARIGWTVIQDHHHNHSRRWVYRSDHIAADPFGQHSVRANMHPGHQSPKHTGPSGPVDPDLSLLAVESIEGEPLALLGNYAMHYFSASTPISADFCGQFGHEFARQLGIKSSGFVGMMSQGTSGDSMWIDYTQPKGKMDLDTYTAEVAKVALEGYEKIDFHDWVPLAMAETKLKFHRRAPDSEQLLWAHKQLTWERIRPFLEKLGLDEPLSKTKIYARELIYLHDEPEVELKLQAIRIGKLGITAVPNEVYGITGLKLKAQSPFETTFNITLANGSQGYIPPSEQHLMGGYTTWPARTAGLEVQAEPKIVEAVLTLLEKVAKKPRQKPNVPLSPYAQGILASKPLAYWQFEEMAGDSAVDTAGNHKGSYEPGVLFYLPGPQGEAFSKILRGNRAAHFAGGRMKSTVKDLGETYSLEMWFWNAFPVNARNITGHLFSYGKEDDLSAVGDHLAIGGVEEKSASGKLVFFNGKQLLVGKTELPFKQWNHIVLVRNGKYVKVYLNGQSTPEINAEAEVSIPENIHQLFIGGRNDNEAPFEGKIDEVSLYDRELTAEEIRAHYQLTRSNTPD